MKILGENSLSSKVICGLYVLFIVISIIDILVISIIGKTLYEIIMKVNITSNILNLNLFIIVIITGIIALFIIYEFIKIFKNLKLNILFSDDNTKRLSIISNSCFIMSIAYLIIAVVVLFTMHSLIEEFIYYIFAFALVFSFIFLVFGIGIKILNEIYKKAIQYKEENDLII